MANVIIDDTHLGNVAAAIREKNGETTTYKPSEMAAAISALAIGGGGGSIDLDNCEVVMLSSMGKVTVSNAYYYWSDWKDYITDLSSIQMFVVEYGNNTCIYVAGIMAAVADGVFNCAAVSNSSNNCTFVDASTVVFSDSGFYITVNGTRMSSGSAKPAMYVVYKKEA